MENIKKVLLSIEDDNIIKKIVIIRESKIERYYSKDNSQEDLYKIYSQCVKKLNEQYASELEGLTINEKVAKLVKLGKIESKKANLIIKLEPNVEERKFVVTYEDGIKEFSEATVGEDKFNNLYDDIFKELCATYCVDFSDYTKTVEKLEELGLYKEFCKTKSGDLPTVEKKHKIRNLILNKKLLYGILGTGTLALMIYGGAKLLKNDSNSQNNVKDDTVDLTVPEVTEMPKFEFEPVEEVTYEEESMGYVPEIYILNEESNFPGYKEPSGKCILIADVNGSEYFGLNESLDELMEIRNANMSDIENSIQSDISLEDQGKYIYFENLFNDYDLADKAFVKYFSMLGNQIIKCAYQDGINYSKKDIQKYSKQSCYDVVRCIRDNEPLSIYLNGHREDLYYSNLSRKAKEVVLNIVFANYAPLNTNSDFYHTEEQMNLGEEASVIEFRYNNEYITKSDIANIILNAYNELMYIK